MSYSPPGHLTINELFEKIFSIYFEYKINSNILKYNNTISDLDDINRANIENILASSSDTIGHTFTIKEINVSSPNFSQDIILECISCNNDAYLFRPKKGRDRSFDAELLNKFIHITKIWKIIRDALCSTIDDEKNKLLSELSFIIHGNQKDYLPSNIWLNDNNWYGLIHDGKLPSNCAVTSIYPYESTREVVYFKEELIILCAHQAQKPLTDNKFHMWTPWLEIMSVFSLRYGEEIKKISKDHLEAEMKVYIDNKPHLKSLKKPISKADIQHMSRFIRLPEQQDGKGFKG